MKTFIVWDANWSTGIKKIDEQHKHFVDVLNKAYYINEKGESKEKLGSILNDLVEFARVHFSTEEKYFAETEYPDADMHMGKHEKLLAKVLYFSQRFEENQEVSGIFKELLIFLKNWLDEHLIKVDHKYIPWLTSHGIK